MSDGQGLTADEGLTKFYGLWSLRVLANSWEQEDAPEAGDIRMCGRELNSALDELFANPS